jgi:hypothetical protein
MLKQLKAEGPYIARLISGANSRAAWIVDLLKCCEGMCIASFMGIRAEERAVEYAHWKNTGAGVDLVAR